MNKISLILLRIPILQVIYNYMVVSCQIIDSITNNYLELNLFTHTNQNTDVTPACKKQKYNKDLVEIPPIYVNFKQYGYR